MLLSRQGLEFYSLNFLFEHISTICTDVHRIEWILGLSVILVKMSFNVNPKKKIISDEIKECKFSKSLPADRTTFILTKPLVNTLHMEEMKARKPPDILIHFKL